MTPPPRADALMDLLFPFWQLIIGVTVAAVVVVVALRLAARGQSRMRTAMVVTGAGIVGLTLFGILQAAADRN
jgi:FtsH-binding integral membrane protein